jgi:hypothetical protein
MNSNIPVLPALIRNGDGGGSNPQGQDSRSGERALQPSGTAHVNLQ